MPHTAFKWSARPARCCCLWFPGSRFMHWAACLPAGSTARLTGHPACRSTEQPSATLGGCAHTRVGPRTHRGFRKANQPFPEHVGCQGPFRRSEAEGAQEFRRRMCLLFDFSVIRPGLWVNPVCEVLSLLQELGTSRGKPTARSCLSWAGSSVPCSAVLAPPAETVIAPGMCSGTGDEPWSPRACSGSRSPCTLGNRPMAGAERIPIQDISLALPLGWGEAGWSLSS